MDDQYPVDDGIHVLKEGRRLGPFSVEDLLDGLESGGFSEEDICLRPGATECERLRDLLDWEAEDSGAEEDFSDGDGDSEDGDMEPPPPHATKRAETSGVIKPDRLLYAGHPSVITYPIALLALILGVTGGVWLYRLDPNFTLAGLGIAIAGLVRLSLARFTHDYQIRPLRLEVITGLIARSSREVRIETVFRYANIFDRALNLIASGKVDLKPLITGVYDFEDSIKAFERAASGQPTDVKLQIVMPGA